MLWRRTFSYLLRFALFSFRSYPAGIPRGRMLDPLLYSLQRSVIQSYPPGILIHVCSRKIHYELESRHHSSIRISAKSSFLRWNTDEKSENNIWFRKKYFYIYIYCWKSDMCRPLRWSDLNYLRALVCGTSDWIWTVDSRGTRIHDWNGRSWSDDTSSYWDFSIKEPNYHFRTNEPFVTLLSHRFRTHGLEVRGWTERSNSLALGQPSIKK